MEKNTVILDIEKYNEMLIEKMRLNKCIQSEINRADLLAKQLNEESERNLALETELIKKCISNFAIRNHLLEELVNEKSWKFAIESEDMIYLKSLEIDIDLIKEVITDVKNEYEATKETEVTEND